MFTQGPYQNLADEYMTEMDELARELTECQTRVQNNKFSLMLRKSQARFEEIIAELQAELDKIVRRERQRRKPTGYDIVDLLSNISAGEKALMNNQLEDPDQLLNDIGEVMKLYNYDLNYKSVQPEGDPSSHLNWRPKEIQRILEEIKILFDLEDQVFEYRERWIQSLKIPIPLNPSSSSKTL